MQMKNQGKSQHRCFQRHSHQFNHRFNQQKGITLIGFLIVLSLTVFVAFMGIKIVPVYIDHYSVIQAMKGVQKEPGIQTATPGKIKDLFFRRLYVSYVDGVEAGHVKVSRANGRTLTVKYSVQKQMVGNVDIIIHFDDSVILGLK
ncbi:MAG: DUF4845 domain-containing protein [Xanthomonadales bacterium]|nr:DUF4845 domain-containing protein [Xanthomonadales bacterium]